MESDSTLDRDTKNAKIMLGIFGVLTLIFVCGGGLAAGIAGAGSESDGVDAALALTGPACCALSGLFTAILALFALPTKTTAQFVAPIIMGIVGGIVGGAGVFIFFQVIWPAL